MRVHGPALLVVAALGGLLLACRGGLPGIPVADDYDSLWALRFQQPFDPFGTFGSLWYWRPLGRQAYFAALGPLLLAAPWIVGVLHAALFALLAWAGFRAAGRAFDRRAAAAIAAFPVLAEPSRALLVWPTGGQPLLALTGIAVALHFAAARKLGPALAAALLALLAHEQALLALPLVPLVARSGVRGFLATAGVAGAWAAARLVAASHGAAFPLLVGPKGALAAFPSLLSSSVLVQLDLAELGGPVRSAAAVALALCGACALVLFLVRRQSRERLRTHAVLLGVAGAWFLLALAPLTFAPELWTPRHSAIPGLGLGVLVVGMLACASPRLAVAFTALRLVLLLAAPTAPAVVEGGFPPAVATALVPARDADAAHGRLRPAHPHGSPSHAAPGRGRGLLVAAAQRRDRVRGGPRGRDLVRGLDARIPVLGSLRAGGRAAGGGPRVRHRAGGSGAAHDDRGDGRAPASAPRG